MILGCKVKGDKKSEYVTKTQFLYFKDPNPNLANMWENKNYMNIKNKMM